MEIVFKCLQPYGSEHSLEEFGAGSGWTRTLGNARS
jgi:hypothetical protein